MSQKYYELTTNGVDEAVGDYIKENWKDLAFSGIEKEEILGFENVSVTIQSDFKGVGDYRFEGDARPQLSEENGYSTDNWRISGFASIKVSQNGSLLVEGFNGPISFTKNR